MVLATEGEVSMSDSDVSAAPGEPALTIEESRASGLIMLGIAGEIDVATVPALTAHLRRALRLGREAVVLDLSGVRFFGAAGLTALLEARREGDVRGVRVGVVPSRAVRGVLDLFGLGDVVDACSTVQAALMLNGW
ncbi:hypothetical protein GCM10017786_00910 [Amycolatopsis deserti]|uniref:STAS domain-containing protein n=1 Tax=Amycolatopsis deserti TaxID=185696 RepID=A0ABQ3IEV2_9PSEU|nr:STAS domain-containing protein [Amycolatopsis deserti]GHE75846.1 hypothetical protein GCM10017786_00910 [Amycolatopsis deserti]